MADMLVVITKVVNELWPEYDKDGSGALDKEESKNLVESANYEMIDSLPFDEKKFEACFKNFEKDG